MTAETGRTDLVTREVELRVLVERTRYVLFDFDGPICRLFARHRAEDIARAQVKWLEDRGLVDILTEKERFSPDPHGVLSTLAERHPGSDLLVALEEHLTRQELRAARSAMPTPYADPLIRTWDAVGARLAIVTNNSPRTVASYLGERGLLECFAPRIYGRTQDLSELKPNPVSLYKALGTMGADREASLMIGDTPSDYAAASSARVPFLAYARHEAARARMMKAGVPERSIVESLEPLLRALKHS